MLVFSFLQSLVFSGEAKLSNIHLGIINLEEILNAMGIDAINQG